MSEYNDVKEIQDRLIKCGFKEENIKKLKKDVERYNKQKAFEAGFEKAVEIMQQLEEENFDGTHLEPDVLIYEEFLKWEEENGTDN